MQNKKFIISILYATFIVSGCNTDDENSKQNKMEKDDLKNSSQIHNANVLNQAKIFLNEYISEVSNFLKNENDYPSYNTDKFPPVVEFLPETSRWYVTFSNGVPCSTLMVELDESLLLGTVTFSSGQVIGLERGILTETPPLFKSDEFKLEVKKFLERP